MMQVIAQRLTVVWLAEYELWCKLWISLLVVILVALIISKIDTSSRRVTSPFFSKNYRIIEISNLYNWIIELKNLQNSKKFSKGE